MFGLILDEDVEWRESLSEGIHQLYDMSESTDANGRQPGPDGGDTADALGSGASEMVPLQRLPPADATPATLLTLSGKAVSQFRVETIRALVGRVDPDLVLATGERANVVAPTLAGWCDVPIGEPGSGQRPQCYRVVDSGVAVVTLPMRGSEVRIEQLSVTPVGDRGGQDVPSEDLAWQSDAVCVVGTELSLNVKPYARATSLDGVSAYRRRLPDLLMASVEAHLSTQLRAGFTTALSEAGDMSVDVVGVGQSATDLGAGARGDRVDPAVVRVYSNGVVDVETVDPERSGLRAIHNVGQSRLQTLVDAGVTTVRELAETPLPELMDLRGFGRTTARNIYTRACAQASRTVQHLSGGSLPREKPVFIDIETDGLNPSTVWLIGVLDGGPEDGRYLTFREDEPGGTAHLEAFVSWLTGPAAGRPVVAWNGHDFDFPVIKDQLQEHHPDYVSEWEDCYQFDAYWWAAKDDGGHVALPGRTNTLEDVATALGWEPTTTGITGETVAEIYTAYRRNCAVAPDAAPEPDWDRLEAYCEDDVRALATIYSHLADVARRDATDQPRDRSTQGSLADYT